MTNIRYGWLQCRWRGMEFYKKKKTAKTFKSKTWLGEGSFVTLPYFWYEILFQALHISQLVHLWQAQVQVLALLEPLCMVKLGTVSARDSHFSNRGLRERCHRTKKVMVHMDGWLWLFCCFCTILRIGNNLTLKNSCGSLKTGRGTFLFLVTPLLKVECPFVWLDLMI